MANIKKNTKSIKNLWNKYVKKNNSFTMQETIIFMIMTFAIGALLGGVLIYHTSASIRNMSGSLQEFIDTYENIVDSYYQDVDSNALIDAGLKGMIDYLGDPYSTYLTGEEASSFNQEVLGEFVGIGAEITYYYDNNKVIISKVMENSPALKANLKVNDELLKVDGVDVINYVNENGVEGIASHIKGEKGTTVTLTISRDNIEREIPVIRDVVEVESVTSNIILENDKKIGYLSLSIFAENTDEQFTKKLKELESNGIDSLIIDVRDNSGGYLTTVTNIVSMFMKKGQNIYQLKTKDKIDVIKDETDEYREYPVVVLANTGSASASEVLASAFKEIYGSKIVGTNTFGKGKVQKAYSLSNGSIVKYTFQEWLTPNGESIDSVGVTPTDYINNESSDDSQLNMAIDLLK